MHLLLTGRQGHEKEEELPKHNSLKMTCLQYSCILVYTNKYRLEFDANYVASIMLVYIYVQNNIFTSTLYEI